jgi:pimeloyl-ACP methyl ester carboxylesterase
MTDHPALSTTAPLEGPTTTPTVPEFGTPERPRLARHHIELSDGHRVGLAVSGRGIPLVVVHGFSAEGFLYAQTLSRLVGMGYRVIAIDTAGHGGTHGLPRTGAEMADYAALLRRALDELGVHRAVLAGHSMGGRIVAELAAAAPHRVVALLLLDAIVGESWDRLVAFARRFPPALAFTGVSLAIDTVSTVPVFRDPRQAAKLMRLVVPTGTAHALRPWRLLAPTVSILRSGGSGPILDRLREQRVPLFALHGDRDYGVPLSTARDAARRARGTLVVVRGGSHSWVLKDPETLPAIVYELLGRSLGDAQRRALMAEDVAPGSSVDDVEAALYEPDAPILDLTPPSDGYEAGGGHGGAPVDPDANPHQPRYDWEIVDFEH